MRGYFLQVGLATDMPDTKRAHWHPAQMDTTQGQTTHPPFRQRFVARITLALDVPQLRRPRPEEPPRLFHVLEAMPPETRLRLVRELELCTQAKLEEHGRAAPGMTNNSRTTRKRMWSKFENMLTAASTTSEPG